jgi:hypothetical protein
MFSNRYMRFIHFVTRLSGAALIAITPWGALAQQPGGVASSPAGQSVGEVEWYWTKERMEAAQPMPTPHRDATTGGLIKPVESEAPAAEEPANCTNSPTPAPGWDGGYTNSPTPAPGWDGGYTNSPTPAPSSNPIE